jgi:hypothetical protein
VTVREARVSDPFRLLCPNEAGGIVLEIAATLDHGHLRARFLARPDVVVVLSNR